MADCMTFPETFDEFAEQYKIVDRKEIYTNGIALIPIFRVKQWLEHQTKGVRVMAEWIKPPLGVSPHWFVYRQRIEELNKAIARYLEHIEKKQHTQELKQEYRAIAAWAKEIQHLALLEADLDNTPKERGGENSGDKKH